MAQRRDFLRHRLGKSFSFYLRYAHLVRARSYRTRLCGDTTLLGIAEPMGIHRERVEYKLKMLILQKKKVQKKKVPGLFFGGA